MTALTSTVFWTAIQAICSVIGLVVIGVLARQIHLANKTMKHQAYSLLDQSYVEFIKSTGEEPDLDFHDFDEAQLRWYAARYHGCHKDSQRLAIKELVHYEVLFSLWEQAFLTRKREWMDESQWIGWHNWMCEYLSRTDNVQGTIRHRIIEAWIIAARTYDECFLQYVADYVIRIALGVSVTSEDPFSQELMPEHIEFPPGERPTGMGPVYGKLAKAELRWRRKQNCKLKPEGA